MSENRPKRNAPNLYKLISVCEEYLDFLESDDYYEDNDYDHYIYEAALEALYGEDVWLWINSHLI